MKERTEMGRFRGQRRRKGDRKGATERDGMREGRDGREEKGWEGAKIFITLYYNCVFYLQIS